MRAIRIRFCLGVSTSIHLGSLISDVATYGASHLLPRLGFWLGFFSWLTSSARCLSKDYGIFWFIAYKLWDFGFRVLPSSLEFWDFWIDLVRCLVTFGYDFFSPNPSSQILRSRYLVFSTQETEEFIGILICLFLERQLLGLTGALHDCLLSAIDFFEEDEWSSSCEKVAILIVHRIPQNLNCLRAVGCISGVDTRSKQLRSVVAYQFLASCYAELTDAKDILKFLMSKNLKDKSCNLFKIYLCLVLVENWLLFGCETNPGLNELWTGFVRKCSIQISNTDFRPCAQEIRNRASFLLHSTVRD